MNVLRLGVFTLASGVKTGNIEVDVNIKENWGGKKSNYATIKLAATTSKGRKSESRLKMLLCCRP